jgi:DNA-binding beta-propeller fold protein YncE
LLRVDTSIGADGETRDVPAGQVEICAQPTSMAIYDDGGSQFALVTCYRSGELFIVDLASFTVVGLSRAGIGPDSLAIDLAREVVYVANSLDGTISIIDMSRSRPTRFNQIARIGLQEPYVQ